jgi:hypothetical protein
MRFLTVVLVVMAAAMVTVAGPAAADLARGQAAFVAGEFEVAYAELYPEAKAGDANAQEMIGIFHAMGIGREVDYQRAFDWYMKASLQGHAGAQSGIGWYYEVGLGVAIDLVQAHMWYALSAAGGDPDAALSLPEVEKKMSADEVAEAQRLARAFGSQ